MTGRSVIMFLLLDKCGDDEKGVQNGETKRHYLLLLLFLLMFRLQNPFLFGLANDGVMCCGIG